MNESALWVCVPIGKVWPFVRARGGVRDGIVRRPAQVALFEKCGTLKILRSSRHDPRGRSDLSHTSMNYTTL